MMTEGSAVRSKRLGARFFKNPPQPHMCIRDTLKGSSDPCYVNVLSWDKVAFGVSSEGVPLYGGMKVCPPRTEKKETLVFAVMVNPEVLKEHGKSARNPKGQTWLIGILLDFIEEMNNGVVFNRCYTVLRDRDITGELKEIWMVVQSERAKAQQITGSDELRRPVPQYPQYQEQLQQQQQQQQQQQLQQQLQHPMSQQHHHPPQQQQQQQHQLQHSYEEPSQQPPQYHSSTFYGQETTEKCENYDISYRRPGQNIMIPHNDRMYQSGTIPQQYHGNTSRVVTDRYMFRDPVVPGAPQVPQQNCIGYPGYQYQQQPRAIGTGPFPPPNVHSNATINCPPPQSTNPLNLVRPEPPIHHYGHQISVPDIPAEVTYPKYYVASRPPQTRGPQLQIPIPQFYEAQNPRPPNFLRMLRPQETENARRTNNTTINTTPSHQTQTKPSTDGLDVPIEWHFIRKPVNQTSLNPSSTRDQNSKKPSTLHFLKLFRPQEPEVNTKVNEHSIQVNTGNNETHSKERQTSPDQSSNSSETLVSRSGIRQQQSDGKATATETNAKNSGKSKMKVLKRNASPAEKRRHIRDLKIYLNGEIERPNDSKSKDRTSGKDADAVEDRLNKVILEAERNGNADKERTKAKNVKKINADLRNAFKILERRDKDTDEVYTILRKPEATASEEDVTSDIAQISIKDCGETSELGAVLS